MKKDTVFNNMIIMAILGMTGVFILNLIGWFLLNQNAADFFKPKWWSIWFPNYIVWCAFIFIAVGLKIKNIK